VLIIEDNTDMREFIKLELQSHYRCLIAVDGDEGIKLAIEHVPDLIITDLMMPKRSGFQLAEGIRNHQVTSHIPIIMLTAKGDEKSRVKAWKTDIDDFFAKPFDSSELRLRCHNLLNIRKILSSRVNNELLNKDVKDIHALQAKDRKFVASLEALVSNQYQNSTLSTETICKELAMSESQLQRKMRALLDQTATEYLRTYRVKQGAQLLIQGYRITDIAYKVGFSSSTYFSSCFKAFFGITPKAYQQQHK